MIMKTLEDYTNMAWIPTTEETRWCKVHERSYWGKTPSGEWYDRCVRGQRDKEQCVVGEQDKEEFVSER